MGLEGNRQPLTVAVVRYPGSNCDRDSLNFFQRYGHKADYLWHKETKSPQADLLFLPGGFAHGDRRYKQVTGDYEIDPGVQALQDPVMDVIKNWAASGKKILAVCNGFQILTHAKLVPGTLEQNESGKFFCDDVDVVVSDRSFFNDPSMLNQVYRINVAHGYGRYSISDSGYQQLIENNQIFLRYHGLNPNGSRDDIAGVTNKEGNIFAMMPHPERITDPVQREKFISAIVKDICQI